MASIDKAVGGEEDYRILNDVYIHMLSPLSGAATRPPKLLSDPIELFQYLLVRVVRLETA